MLGLGSGSESGHGLRAEVGSDSVSESGWGGRDLITPGYAPAGIRGQARAEQLHSQPSNNGSTSVRIRVRVALRVIA